MKRQIITINEAKCNGCGLCVTGCPEGALQVIEGKARLVGDLYCDGLGACLGRCPEGAIEIEEREAAEYDEFAVMANIEKQGKAVIKAHLVHLRNHGADAFYRQAMEYLLGAGYDLGEFVELAPTPHTCPGSTAMTFDKPGSASSPGPVNLGAIAESALSQWPIQMHLINPRASHFSGADFLLAADCTAFALGTFHPQLLAGKKLGIACPKLDANKEIYVDKLVALIDEMRINTLIVAIMEVPCCGGLSSLAVQAAAKAQRKVPVKLIVMGIRGSIVSEEWM